MRALIRVTAVRPSNRLPDGGAFHLALTAQEPPANDAFNRAIDEAIERGDPYDLSSLKMVISSGVMWTSEVKEAMLDRIPQAVLVDAISPLMLQTDDAQSIARALSSLPDHFHQLLVLRELEELSYRELSEVIGIPMGTVMSRLSRARDALRRALDARLPPPGMSLRIDAQERKTDAVVMRTAWTRNVREAIVENRDAHNSEPSPETPAAHAAVIRRT